MTNFKDIMGKLFPTKLADNKVVLNDLINRSAPYQDRYAKWCSEYAETFLNELSKSYHEKVAEIQNSGIQVHLLNTKYSNGIAISFDTNHYSKEEFSFLFDLLAEKVNKIPTYKMVNSDFMIKEKKTFIETKEKHYLKPFISKNDAVIDQQFGNILIEHILVDDQPSYLKLIANIYSDSNYKAAKDFNSLISMLID